MNEIEEKNENERKQHRHNKQPLDNSNEKCTYLCRRESV